MLPDGRLVLPDTFNSRVLVYASVPETHNASALFSVPAALATQVSYHDNQLIVADLAASRVVIYRYDTLAQDGTAVPDVVVGKPDLSSGDNRCDDRTLSESEAAIVTPQGKLVVADRGHNRVLIWHSVPTSDGQPADLVLGQGSFVTCNTNDDDQDSSPDAQPTARTLRSPTAVWSDGIRLVVSDTYNHRVLIWNQFPTSSFAPADLVLGQADFEHGAPNDDDQNGVQDATPSARTLSEPNLGLASDGVQLAVTDAANHRVLLWNTFPTRNFQPADVVLGQSSFAGATHDDDDQDGQADTMASARVLNYPTGLALFQDKLLVTDTGDNRVLIFNKR